MQVRAGKRPAERPRGGVRWGSRDMARNGNRGLIARMRATPSYVSVPVGVALVLGLFYLALPMAAGDPGNRKILRVSALGGMAPFLFASATWPSRTLICGARVSGPM